MNILNYIFDIGIVFIVFSGIWGLFMLLLNIVTLGQRKGIFEENLLKIANYFFIVTLTAVVAMKRGELALSHERGYLSIGAIVLFLYLVGKLEKRRRFMRIYGQMGKFRFESQKQSRRIDSAYLVGGLSLYVVCILAPELAMNKATMWFYGAIVDINNTPVIGWIIKIIGFFFLISLIFRGIWVVSRLFQSLSGTTPPESGPGDPYSNSDDESQFTDYEIIEDDEDDEKSTSGDNNEDEK